AAAARSAGARRSGADRGGAAVAPARGCVVGARGALRRAALCARMPLVRHAVILAGGSGTRLWPAGRRARPQQLLPVGRGGGTVLGAAPRGGGGAPRGVGIAPAESQVEATRQVGPAVELIAEPMARNTAAALGLAAATLAERDPAAVMVVLPADQYVADEPGLTAALEAALAAGERDDAIGTVGIAPSRAGTGVRYLEGGGATPGPGAPGLP